MLRRLTLPLLILFVLAGVNLAQAQIPMQQGEAPKTEIPTETPMFVGTPAPLLTPTQLPINPNPTKTPKPKVDEALQGVYALPPIWALERLTSLEINGLEMRGEAPDPLLDALDAALPEVWVQVMVIQMDYYTQSGGHYIQGLYSHSSAPANGQNQFPDNFLTFPTDFPASWMDTAILPYSPSPYRYWMDVYDGPYGTGFTFCVEISIGGGMWQKCYNYGGEIWRAFDWTLVEIP